MSNVKVDKIEYDVKILESIEKEVDKRIIMCGQVHNEDLIHFLMADYQFDEKVAKDYVDLYTSYFSEDVEEEDDDPT